jgi:hypothetical protein
MVVFLCVWQLARIKPPKEIKFQQSHAHTCAQGIINTVTCIVGRDCKRNNFDLPESTVGRLTPQKRS